MKYHAINETGTIPVYSQSICQENSHVGNLYNGEIFTYIEPHTGYGHTHKIRFLNSSNQYAYAFINSGQYGNIATSGTYVSDFNGSYKFKLRSQLNLITGSGYVKRTLTTGDYVYIKNGAKAGDSNDSNIEIVGYKSSGKPVTSFSGYVTLNYRVCDKNSVN